MFKPMELRPRTEQTICVEDSEEESEGEVKPKRAKQKKKSVKKTTRRGRSTERDFIVSSNDDDSEASRTVHLYRDHAPTRYKKDAHSTMKERHNNPISFGNSEVFSNDCNAADEKYERDSQEAMSDEVEIIEQNPHRRVTRSRKAVILNDDDDEQNTIFQRLNADVDDDSDYRKGTRRQWQDEWKKAKVPEKLNIRNRALLKDADLNKSTLQAQAAERERVKRLQERQKEFNDVNVSITNDAPSEERLQAIVLDTDKKSQDPIPVEVADFLVQYLKPMQEIGIRFIYNSLFESIDRTFTDGVSGGGGILAHCMGLGKTLQTIAFLYAVMRHQKLSEKARRILVIVPVNVVLNWYNEFEKWLGDDGLQYIDVMELDGCKNPKERKAALADWFHCEKPSVMIIGYDMYRILTERPEDRQSKKRGKSAKPKQVPKPLRRVQDECRKYLQDPGPDIVVCDEAHKLKNDQATITSCISRIRTLRRLCLTGTPMQNHLDEYYIMVNFVKPGLLGTRAEYRNRFVNPIERGKTKNATVDEVKQMRMRCHVLYDLLKNVVERKDVRELAKAIPPKQEYLLMVRLTDCQIQLYQHFLDNVVTIFGKRGRAMIDYYVFSRIWTHPHQLITHFEEFEVKQGKEFEKEQDRLFVAESSSDKENDDSILQPVKKRKITTDDGDEPMEEDKGEGFPYDWFAKTGLVNAEDECNYELSGKLMLIVDLLKKCEEIGDKMLIFTQSLESLRLLKRMLVNLSSNWFLNGHEAVNAEGGKQWDWIQDRDFVVIDGSVSTKNRLALQDKFNDPENRRLRLMLISTKAGSLGVNLIAANRVIIFDHNWNPSHDTQALFRVYRFGQTKPTYIYRLVAQGTMEERIYNRQVTKESTSMRVVDEAQIQRHFFAHDLEELYLFDPAEKFDEKSAMPVLPKDRLLADVILANRQRIVSYNQHDSLFDHVDDEKLTKAEIEEAWEKYKYEKKHGAAMMAMAKQTNEPVNEPDPYDDFNEAETDPERIAAAVLEREKQREKKKRKRLSKSIKADSDPFQKASNAAAHVSAKIEERKSKSGIDKFFKADKPVYEKLSRPVDQSLKKDDELDTTVELEWDLDRSAVKLPKIAVKKRNPPSSSRFDDKAEKSDSDSTLSDDSAESFSVKWREKIKKLLGEKSIERNESD